MIPPVPHVAALSAYALADLNVPEGKRLVSLSQNECLRPPSPLAIEAGANALATANLYPDPEWTELRAAIATTHNIDAEAILCGNGSLDLIGCVARAFADKDNAVLAPAHAYPFFRSATQMANARFDTAPEDGTTVSVDQLRAAERPDTRLVFVANPGNPTGTRLSRVDLMRLRDGLRDDILLVIDEAYGEFTDHLSEPCFDMVAQGNTVVLRTLSKAYGMAGMRVGWGYFPPQVAREIRKMMSPNSISIAGQAMSVAALNDQDYMRETVAITQSLRAAFVTRLQNVGFDVAPSHANFVMVKFNTPEDTLNADNTLRSEGVFLRGQAGAGLASHLRITITSGEDLDLAAGLLQRWKEGPKR